MAADEGDRDDLDAYLSSFQERAPSTADRLERIGFSLAEGLGLTASSPDAAHAEADPDVDEDAPPEDVLLCYVALRRGVIDLTPVPPVEVSGQTSAPPTTTQEQGSRTPTEAMAVPWAALFAHYRLPAAVELVLGQRFYRNFEESHGSAMEVAVRRGARECVRAMVQRGAGRPRAKRGEEEGDEGSSLLCQALAAMRDRRRRRSRGVPLSITAAEARGGGMDGTSPPPQQLRPEPIDYDGVVEVLLDEMRATVGLSEVQLAISAGVARVPVVGWKQRMYDSAKDFGTILAGGTEEAVREGDLSDEERALFLSQLLEELGAGAAKRLPTFGRTADPHDATFQGGVAGGPRMKRVMPDDVLCYRAMTTGLAPPSCGRILPPPNTSVPWTLLFAAHRRPEAVELALGIPRAANGDVDKDDGDSGRAAPSELDEGHTEFGSFGSALTMAAKNGATSCVDILLKRGADPNMRFAPGPRAMYQLSVLKATLQLAKTWREQLAWKEKLRATGAGEGATTTITATAAETAAAASSVETPKEDITDDDDDINVPPQEPVDYDGTIRALLRCGAMVGREEAELALELRFTPVVEAALRDDALDLTDLLASTVMMTAESLSSPSAAVGGGGAESAASGEGDRLKLLLDHGANPLAALTEDLPLLPDGKSSVTVLEVAIQSGSIDAVRTLLQYARKTSSTLLVESYPGIMTRALSYSVKEDMLQVLEEALLIGNQLTEMKSSADDDAYGMVANTTTFEIESGTAWVGNMVDFDDLLRRQANEETMQSGIAFDSVAKGKWFVFATPWMQLTAHKDCPEEYLAGAIAGAIYGGFKDDEWNPLTPPASDVIFTGRMAYSEMEPRHVTWFTDPIAAEWDEIRNAAVPSGDVLTGKLRNRLSVSGALKHSGMWTSCQEYRYGLLVGGKCFISIGYEGMDLQADAISLILDGVVRAKRHCAAAPQGDAEKEGEERRQHNTTRKRRFCRTEYTDTENVPKKRTNQEIFEKRLEDGWRFTGLDFLRMYTPNYPSQDELTRFAPPERLYLASDLDPLLARFKNAAIAEPLIDDFCLLLDELVMMMIDSRLVPAMVAAFADVNDASGETDDYNRSAIDAQAFCAVAADAAFPTHERVVPSVDHHCHKSLTQLKPVATTDDNRPRQELHSRILDFLGQRGMDRTFLSSSDVIARVVRVCDYVVTELLELANNGRRDCGYDKLVPQHLRLAILNDQQLFEACNAARCCELYFPSNTG